PAAVGIHRPAGARSARRAGAGHRGRRRRGPPGPGPGCLRAGRAAAAPAPARAALALRPRCLPQGARGDRRRVARGPAPGAAPVSGLRAQTLAVRAGIDRDEAFGAVTPPLVLSSNFSFAGFAAKRTYDYSRSGNPTRDLFAGALAELEGGAGAVVTGSGMSAATLALHALLPRGARVVVPHDCYGGCWRLFDALSRKGQFTVATADLTDPRALADALREPTALVWIETPSNPLLRITDLRFVVEAAHRAGALALVDNTFLSPAWQRPIAFGADVVLHSTTKYVNGHGDVVGGALVARDAALHDTLAWWANALGVTGAPFDSFLALRGLRTLDARLRVHAENIEALVAVLDGHTAVRALHWPGLASHPGHAVAARQQAGFGAML